MWYWDSSALVKLYIPDEDSDAFLEAAGMPNQAIVSSVVAGVEVPCAILRAECDGRIGAAQGKALRQQFERDCENGRIVLLSVGEDVRREAIRLAQVSIPGRRMGAVRSLDLIHAATAALEKATVLVTADMRPSSPWQKYPKRVTCGMFRTPS